MRNKSQMQEKILLEAEQDFPQFLKQVRKEQNILLEQLADGLMTASQLARIEKRQRPVHKNMRDRLLGRLGVAREMYENLLNIEDHAAWECERNILCSVEQCEIQKAQELIVEYENKAPVGDKIKQQFCLVMKAEVLKQQKADWQEIADCYEKAVKLTVPDVKYLRIKKKLLSIQEINMILEYEFYHKSESFAEKCKNLMTFVENSAYDNLSKVKVYPKIVSYYLQEVLEKQEEQKPENLRGNLRFCNQAIEMLRDTGRAYYLLELLEMKNRMLSLLEQDLEENENLQELKDMKTVRQESTELAGLLKKLCTEYDVPVYMQDCTYLYRQRWMFYVGDVLRIRRKMYGLTQKQLCEGICSVRTLRRAEKREANMQHELLGVLLRKLGLSKEFQKARLVTNDREVLELREEIAICRNNRETEKAKEVLQQIKAKVPVEVPENQQYFIELEASLDWMERKITNKEFVAREEEALKCTLGVSKLYNADDIYFTEMEILCICKRIQALEDEEKRKNIDFMLHFFKGYEEKSTLTDCIIIYEFVMICVVNELGNLGEGQLSIDLGRKVLIESLKRKRIREIDRYLYEIIWNESQLLMWNQQLIEEKMTEGLKQCIILSHFYRQHFYEEFYQSRIHQVTVSSGKGRSLSGEACPSSE